MALRRRITEVAIAGRAEASVAVPGGLLVRRKPEEFIPSRNNPRHLFDPEQLEDLKKNIGEHGVLVPITVYQPKGQKKFTILDGERRHRCCVELEREGREITIPANVVEPPDKIAGLLYMFSIHNLREQWELMPTALSLRIVMEGLGERDNKVLSKLTSLSEAQLERCKKLLTFPERFQNLSLDPDPKTRIPSNFWIEAFPVLDLCEREMPDLVAVQGRDGLTDILVEKYRAKAIKSVIHFRRIMEAYEDAEDVARRAAVVERVREYLLNVQLETRKAFDEFVVDNRRTQRAVDACETFLNQLARLKLDYTLEKDEITQALQRVRDYADQLIEKFKGSDPPPVEIEEDEA